MVKKPSPPVRVQPGRKAVTDRLRAQVQKMFLAELAEGWSVSHAAKVAGSSRTHVYAWRMEDEKFAKAWEDAIEQGTDKLEDAMTKRATDGTNKPVFQGGMCVGHVTEYSDQLAMFMAKGRRPDKYRENRQVSLTGANNGPVVMVTGQMTPQQAAEAYAATLTTSDE